MPSPMAHWIWVSKECVYSFWGTDVNCFFLGLGRVGHRGHAVLLCLWEGECWVDWQSWGRPTPLAPWVGRAEPGCMIDVGCAFVS